MANFAPVLPPAFYPLVDKGRYHMLQAHMLLNNPELVEWAGERGARSRAHHLMLDNGMIELGQPDPDSLIKACQKVFPDEAVCPDIAFNMDETCKFFLKHALEIAKYVGSVMIVPQGKDLPEWMECTRRLVAYAAENHVDIVIGVSRLINTFQGERHFYRLDTDTSPRRAVLAWLDLFMTENGFWHDVHLLGMSYSLFQARQEVQHVCVRSIDSTLPFAHAFQGEMSSLYMMKAEMPPEAWEAETTQELVDLATLNVAYAAEAVRYE